MSERSGGEEPAPSRRSPALPSRRTLQRVILVLLAVAFLGFLVKGANRPPDPYLATGSRQPVEGFGEIAFRVDRVDRVGRVGRVDRMDAARRCALLAETSAQRSRGLMGRTDLAGYDGMLFVYDSDTTTRFYMLNTPLPLSIAWFDGRGRFVSSADMQPCLDRPDCPLYAATGPYRYALEVPQGGLEALGIGPGSSLSVGGGCT